MTDKEALEHLLRLADGGTNHSHDSNEACRIGAEAVREREERSKGCRYCKQEQKWGINFCPMCGRPLKTAMPGEEV